MKKSIVFILFFSIVFCGFSQTERKHGIGLDLFDLAILHTIDVTYEYVGKKNWGFGLTARYCFDSDNIYITDVDEKYSFTPFVRYYFTNKQDFGSKGFYVESFLKGFGYESYRYKYDYDCYYCEIYDRRKRKNDFDVAFGVGLGFKHISNNGFVLDLNLGLGRPLGISDNYYDIVGRGSILIGYCF